MSSTLMLTRRAAAAVARGSALRAQLARQPPAVPPYWLARHGSSAPAAAAGAEPPTHAESRSPPPPPPSPPPPPAPGQPGWVTIMNDAIERFPVETIVLYVASDISSIFFAYNLVDALGYAGDADLAVALVVSRLLRRPRLPLDVGVAALLARAYPPLTQVNLSRLFSRTAAPAAPVDGTAPPPPSARQRFVAAVKRLADRYGIAFLASQRMVVGLASTLSVYALLRAGVDVQGALAGYGLDVAGSMGKVAGRYAAAMCVAALAFPGVVLGAGFLAGRVVGPWRLRMAAAAAAAARKGAPPPPPPKL